jgi:hypothetical protein
MNNPKVRPEVLASIEHLLMEHTEVWRLLTAYDNGTLTQREKESIDASMEQIRSAFNVDRSSNG